MAGEATPTLRHRRLVVSTNVLAQILLLLALAVAANWLVARHYVRFDWTKSGYYKLSDKMKQTLVALKTPVKVVVFLPPNDRRDYVEKVLQDTRNLLEECLFVAKDKLPVEYVDPQRDLARAQQLVKEYNLDSPDVVIFACGARHKYVNLDDMVEFDQSDPYGMGGGRRRVRAFKGEGAFLSAIQTVTEEEPPKVYFLTGHGERDPENYDQRTGFSTAASYIKRDNITVQKWNLLEKQALPTNAAAIVIAGPQKQFSDVERNALDEYLKNHGRLLVLVDPQQKTGLEDWLRKWNVQVDDDLVTAKGGMLLGTELVIVDALGSDYAPHPITAKLRDINTSFPYARSIRRLEAAPGSEQAVVTELVKTPTAFWGETDYKQERMEFNPDKDVRGPLSLAVAVETAKPQGVDVNLGVTRMVVVGNSGFADNGSVMREGNMDFLMNSLNWLMQREHLVAVGPKVPDEFALNMSVEQVRAVYAFVIVGLPLAVAVLGLCVWTSRRK